MRQYNTQSYGESGKTRELGRAERRLHQARVVDRAQMPMIVFEFDRIGGQGHGLVLHLERAIKCSLFGLVGSAHYLSL